MLGGVDGPITAPDLAHTVTGFATVLSGLVALALTALMGGQPWRWLAVYAAIFVGGVPKIWHHAWEEAFWPGLADIVLWAFNHLRFI
ncbi:MAG: hypothetical protein JXA93_17905 [Anaerolineae bacterium]|nr:hypothetical protein [Anaerolineae bacterium]